MLASFRHSLFRASHVLSRPISSNASKAPLKDSVGLTNLLDTIVVDPPSTLYNPNKWRTFYAGEIVTPNELSPEKCLNQRKFTRRPTIPPPAPVTRYNDVFRQLSLDPLDFSLDPAILSTYTSEMGKIYGRNVTGLSSRSQRRLGKAIRRARMVGILPQLSRPSKSWVPIHYRKYGR